MKRALITGMSGTLGQVLHDHLVAQGGEVIGWNRKEIPIDDYHAMLGFIEKEDPDAIFHLATASNPTGRENESWVVNYEWTSELAWITRQLDIEFIFTSSVMVFTDDAIGPFTVDSQPDAIEGYGFEKFQAEERTLYQNPNAIVARIGWQIGMNHIGNHMLAHLYKQAKNAGKIDASTEWLPACSFLQDTAQTLVQLADFSGGKYLINSNEKWSYYEIVSALNNKFIADWLIEPNQDFVYDQRMLDDRVPIASLSKRLSTLS